MPGTRGLPHPAEVCPAASATHELWPRSLRSTPTPQNKTLPLPPPSLPPPSLSPSSSLDHPRRIKSNLINLLRLSRQIGSEMVPRLCLLQLCERRWARRSWVRPSPQAWAARPGCRACGSLGLRKHYPPMEVGAEANRLNLAVKTGEKLAGHGPADVRAESACQLATLHAEPGTPPLTPPWVSLRGGPGQTQIPCSSPGPRIPEGAPEANSRSVSDTSARSRDPAGCVHASSAAHSI